MKLVLGGLYNGFSAKFIGVGPGKSGSGGGQRAAASVNIIGVILSELTGNFGNILW
jgi:hypothetical protein